VRVCVCVCVCFCSLRLHMHLVPCFNKIYHAEIRKLVPLASTGKLFSLYCYASWLITRSVPATCLFLPLWHLRQPNEDYWVGMNTYILFRRHSINTKSLSHFVCFVYNTFYEYSHPFVTHTLQLYRYLYPVFVQEVMDISIQ
jgi:hypothetical protein